MDYLFLFKGTVPRDFNPAVIFIKQFPWYPDSGVEALAPKSGVYILCFIHFIYIATWVFAFFCEQLIINQI
jgi:hypothetical protein